MKKGVIFDMDGTLLNTICDLTISGNHVLAQHGLPIYTEDEYKLIVGNGIPKMVQRMLTGTNSHMTAEAEEEAFSKVSKELFQRVYDEFVEYYDIHSEDHSGPYEGLQQLLGRLYEAGIKIAVISNKADDVVKATVQKHFGPIFTFIAGAREGIPNKPDPTSALEAVQLFGLKKEDILYVGDSSVDMITAAGAGLTSCGVLWGFRSKQELQRAGAVHFAADAAELEKLIME